MTTALDPLILDFVEWVARTPRPYREALEVWRTSCPRLTVWEEAAERGLVERRELGSEGMCLVATETGVAFLAAARRAIQPAILNSQ